MKEKNNNIKCTSHSYTPQKKDSKNEIPKTHNGDKLAQLLTKKLKPYSQ
jgi:hypothetical protein